MIESNNAIEFVIGIVFLTSDPSVISNTRIYKNNFISKDQIALETSDSCTHLCFLRQEMREYLLAQDLDTISESEYLFQALQASFDIVNSTSITDQSVVLLSFLSTVNIINSSLKDLNFYSPVLNILSSRMEIENVTLENSVRWGNLTSLIFINSGVLTVKSLTHSDSNSELILSLYSNATLEGIKFVNVTDCPELVKIYF